MHIPDGYLGPPTWVSCYGICLALWSVAAKKVKATLDIKRVPLMAISAAFSFLIMMFNIPIPGGTTGHAVGGVLIAIAIGPWAASNNHYRFSCASVAFGDGGVAAIGANCINMAFIMPFTGYGYSLLLKIFPKIILKRVPLVSLVGLLNSAALMTA
jgi:cobalt/nickel transport system permease protein